MSDYATPYDLAADQYANGDYDTYVGEATGPDGVVYDVEVHPTKHDTLVVTGPNGRGHEVDASASKHHPGEPIEAAYLRIATEHLRETR